MAEVYDGFRLPPPQGEVPPKAAEGVAVRAEPRSVFPCGEGE